MRISVKKIVPLYCLNSVGTALSVDNLRIAGKKSGHIDDLISSVVAILKRTYFNKYSKAKSDGWRSWRKSSNLSIS
jgi:hypothetical protein